MTGRFGYGIWIGECLEDDFAQSIECALDNDLQFIPKDSFQPCQAARLPNLLHVQI